MSAIDLRGPSAPSAFKSAVRAHRECHSSTATPCPHVDHRANAATKHTPASGSAAHPARGDERGECLPGAIARRAALGATLTPIVHPGLAPPEPRYRPSKKLADFIRCRDQTCRFPGCREPATRCDVDHTIPWPYGPTAAANLDGLCRRHHLLKTSGAVKWGNDETHPAMLGRDAMSCTTPGSRLLFPN